MTKYKIHPEVYRAICSFVCNKVDLQRLHGALQRIQAVEPCGMLAANGGLDVREDRSEYQRDPRRESDAGEEALGCDLRSERAVVWQRNDPKSWLAIPICFCQIWQISSFQQMSRY